MQEVVLNFPFVVDGKEMKSTVKTLLERKLAVISFSLPFDLDISINAGTLLDKTRRDELIVYTFEMESLDSALEWLDSKELEVGFGLRNGDCNSLEKEMDDFMSSYGEKERKTKKRLVIDSEGYRYYK